MMHASENNQHKDPKPMKEAQLKKLGNLFDAIDAVISDPEIPINKVSVVRCNDDALPSNAYLKPGRVMKREYTEDELKARAAEHARLSNAIESYRIHELQENDKILVTTTHLAAALKKTKYDIINHLKALVKDGRLNYIIQSFSIKDDDPEYKKNVKLIDFNELADIEAALPEDEALFETADLKTLTDIIKNGITGSEDMIAPIM